MNAQSWVCDITAPPDMTLPFLMSFHGGFIAPEADDYNRARHHVIPVKCVW